MKSETLCESCRRPRATLSCGLCKAALCKDCATFLDADAFSFQAKVPEKLKHTYYCAACFSTEVAPAQETYQEILERAREVFFFFKGHKRVPPLLKRAKETLQVRDCPDRDETILRLGFLAAEKGYNAVVEAEVVAEKVRNGGHQTSRWKGVGVSAEVDAERLESR